MGAESLLRRERKFHDAWAFILYMLLVVVFVSLAIVGLQSPHKIQIKQTKVNSSGKTYTHNHDVVIPKSDPILNGNTPFLAASIILVVNLLTNILFNLISLVLAKYCSILVIYAALIIPICIMFGMSLWKPMPTSFMVVGFLVVCAIVTGIYLYRHREYISAVISCSATILLANLVPLLINSFTFSLFCSLIFAVEFYCFMTRSISPALKSVHCIFGFFYTVWTIMLGYYLFQVFVASTVINHICDVYSIATAYYNSFYAAGSAAFGGLIVAIIRTLRMCVDNASESNSRARERGNTGAGALVNMILLYIVGLILWLLEEFVNNINQMAFPYLAMYGESYRDSIKGSASALANSHERNLAAFIGVSFCNFALSFVFFICSIFVLFISLLAAKLDLSAMLGWLIPFVIILSLLSVSFFFSMLDSGTTAVIYMRIFEPERMIEYDSEMSQTMLVKSKEMQE